MSTRGRWRNCERAAIEVGINIRAAITGNAGTDVCFGVGAEDAAILAPEFAPFPARELIELSRGEAYVRMLSEGERIEPFKVRTFPPFADGSRRRETVIAQSRRRWSRPRKEVEDKISRWLGRG